MAQHLLQDDKIFRRGHQPAGLLQGEVVSILGPSGVGKELPL